MTKLSKAEIVLLLAVVAVTLGVRLAHMTGPLDESSWRQSWCAYQARELARESPPEFLRVKINYKGTNDVSVWNLPVYESVVAMAYKAAGGERLPLARLITLIFFLGSAWYLFRSVELLLGRRTAAYAATVYLVAPVGLFYSRAVHYDISTLFLCHALFYWGLRFGQTGRWRFYAGVVIAAVLAFANKPPFAFYFALPVAAWAVTEPGARRFRSLFAVAGMFVLPVAAAWAMHEYRLALEGGMTASILYPDPYTKSYARSWYFGAVALRLDPARWAFLARQVVWVVLTPIGVYAAACGLFTMPSRSSGRGWFVVAAWLAGVAAYVLLVFPMVASPHDYYLLPLIAPAAVLIGAFLDGLGDGMSRRGVVLAAMTLAFLVAGAALGVRRASYFTHDWQRIMAGRAIEQNTEPDDLVVSSAKGRSTGGPDPRILYFADRRGWVNSFENLTAENVRTYAGAGARYLGLLMTPDYPPAPEQYPALAGYPSDTIDLKDPAGNSVGWLMLFDLSK